MERPLNLTVHPIDLAIIVVYMVGVVLFGMWIGRGQKDMSSYLLGDRNIPWWGLMGSIVATETSTATFLSVPGIAFIPGGDLRFLQLAFGFIVGRILVSAWLLPLYFKGELFSAYEVLQTRFGRETKLAASLMFLVARNFADGLRLYLAGVVLEKVTGFDLGISIVIMGFLTIVYTFFGGMKAIVWTDCIQFVIYISGGILAFFLILRGVPDGWNAFQTFAAEHQKFRFIDTTFDIKLPYTVWAGLFGGVLLTMGTHGTDQMMVQRYLSARSRTDAAMALIGSGFIVFLQFALFLFLGIALATFYSHFPPKTDFARGDEVFATYIVTYMPAGIVGLILAAVASAAMSTLSSSLNSSASAAVNDIYLPARKLSPTSQQAFVASRVFTVIFGIVQISVGIAASFLAGSVINNALAISGFTAGIMLGMYGLGVLVKSSHQTGALIGMVLGLAILSFVFVYTTVAWPWYSFIGFTSTFLFGGIFSLLIPRRNSV
ncbi:MAG: sodium:solute symporter [Planctomycetaceae bacterium]|nr:sodium:solute symporter [Planctomycetaceae bacterium]